MNRLLLRLRYGFEMTLAYLADNMGDGLTRANHEAEADRLAVEYWKAGL